MLAVAPKYTRAYLMRGEVALKQQDTLRALNDFNTAIEMDKYDPDAWASRAIVRLQQGKYAEAESDLNHATHLNAKMPETILTVLWHASTRTICAVL